VGFDEGTEEWKVRCANLCRKYPKKIHNLEDSQKHREMLGIKTAAFLHGDSQKVTLN